MFSHPVDEWSVHKDDAISAVVAIPVPVDSEYDPSDPFVGLYVPRKWKRLSKFTTLLAKNRPRGFDHIEKHPNEGFSIDYPIWKYVPYGDFVNARAGFDLPAFLRAPTTAAKSIVAMKKDIDRLLARLR
jgi:hypothetical protein